MSEITEFSTLPAGRKARRQKAATSDVGAARGAKQVVTIRNPKFSEAPQGTVTRDNKVGKGGAGEVIYRRTKGIDDFVSRIDVATPMQLVETERKGVVGVFIKDLSKRMEIPAGRMFAILGVPKATAEKKVAAGEYLRGSGGSAALGMARLLGVARAIVENSKAPEAKDFDSARWLGQWLERPQPALGGRKPADLIDTPTGLNMVVRLLGSIESGAYQ